MEVSLKILFESLLNEGRTKSVIDKWSNYVIPGHEDRGPMKNNEEWDYVVKTVTSPENDPSGNGKYIDWVLARLIDFINYNGGNPPLTGELDFLLELVDDFHRFSERNLIQNKDIYSPVYKDLGKLNDVVREASRKAQEIAKEKELKTSADKIYQDDRWIVIVPKTHDASCHYGAGTKWCTTAKHSPSHFNTYTTNAVLYYILDKTRKEGTLYKLAIWRQFAPGREVRTVDQKTGYYISYTPLVDVRGYGNGFDEEDHQIDLKYVIPLLPKGLIDAMDAYYFNVLNRINNKKREEAVQKYIENENIEKLNSERRNELQKVFVSYIVNSLGFNEIFDDLLSDNNVTNPQIRAVYGRWSYMTYEEGRFQIYQDTSYAGDSTEEVEPHNYFIEGKIFPNENTFFSYRLYKTKEDGGFGTIEDAEPVSDLVEVPIVYLFSVHQSYIFERKFRLILHGVYDGGLDRLGMIKDWDPRSIIIRMTNKNDDFTQLIENLLDSFSQIFEKRAFNSMFKGGVPAKDGSVLWRPSNSHSSYQFEYPAHQNSLTSRFLNYIRENPGKTAEEFYQDVLGHSRPAGHNSTFFGSIKDSGLVRMERRGRRFVYFIGPNYETWTQGKLKRV